MQSKSKLKRERMKRKIRLGRKKKNLRAKLKELKASKG